MIRTGWTRHPAISIVGCAILVAPGPAAGQFEELDAVEVGLGVAGWTGAQAARFEPGPQGVLALQVDVGSRRHIGFEFLYGRFAPDVPGTAVEEIGLGFTGRRALDGLGTATPFVQIRVGGHRLDGTGARSDAHQIGLRAGPEVGVLIPTGREGWEVLTAFELSWLWYRDATDGTRSVEGSGGYAFRWGLRLGVSVAPQG